MTQEKGIPYQRHKPSAALREFLDPLDPGSYFDCGRARLRGLDDALLAEARSRGRDIGDDSFQLVATDMGVIYCRPSISFAIAARWSEVTIIRPHGDDPVVLAITFPTHGELKFTLSKRVAGNIFRRWLQLRMQTERARRAAEAIEAVDDEREVQTGQPKKEQAPEPIVESPVAEQKQKADTVEKPIQGKDRVAATVAEAAAVVGKRRGQARASVGVRAAITRPGPRGPRDLVNADVDIDGPETWELVSKVKAPKRKDPDQGRQSAKVDRRQNPDALRRKRQEKAATDSRRRRRPEDLEPSPQSHHSRWFSDLEQVARPPIPAYDIPPLQSPDPGRPTRPAVKRQPQNPDPVDAPIDIPTDVPVEAVVEVALPPEVLVEVPIEIPTEDSVEHVAEIEASANEVEQPIPDELPERSAAAVTGDHHSSNTGGQEPPSLPALLVIDRPEPPKPSWIGSPVSLVAAMVIISTFVLIGAVAVGSYRRSSEVAAGVNPAGPTVSIIDHQRFRPTSDSGPSASDLGQPGAARYSETTAPPSTIGSGSAPITSIPTWPPQDGPQTCNSNYSGCVPDVGDVDCPNDGDGPIYWPESAMVMGEDVYELDTDGDGEICEPDQPPLVGANGGSRDQTAAADE